MATSVKGVGSVMDLSAAAANMTVNAAKNASGDFQSVFNSQSGMSDAAAKSKPTKPRDDAAKPGEDLRADRHRENKVKKPDAEQTKTQDDLSEEDLEKVSEAVGAAAQELIEQIADTFGITEEAVTDLMDQMQMAPEDLFNPEQLSNLLLQVSGGSDSLSLITNEQLYSDFQMLMEEGRQTFEAVSEELGMTPQELAQVIDEKADDLQPDENPELPTVDSGAPGAVEAQKPEQPQARPDGHEAGADRQTRHGGHEEGSNLVLETLREQQFDPQVADVAQAAEAERPDTQNIMRQIMDYMRVQLKPDMSDLEMQLHPASLGTLQVHLASRGGVVTANFVTQNEAVKAAIESQMVQLKESFEEQGVKVQAIEVTVQTHQFEQNLEQGRGRQPQETGEGRRARVRRISLDGLDGGMDADALQELEQEDRITAEMMAANGTTVDFTA